MRSRSHLRKTALAVAVVVVTMPTIAVACTAPPPAPPPNGPIDKTYLDRVGVIDRQRIALGQSDNWERAARVMLVKVIEPRIAGKTGLAAQVQPVALLKGEPSPAAFVIASSGWAECRRDGAEEAAKGKKGELFVVYLTEGPPGVPTTIAVDRLEWIVDPRIKAKLPRARRRPR
jgi:hypothetical protein